MPAGAPSYPLLHLLSSPFPSSVLVPSPTPLTPTPHRPTGSERARAALVDESGDAWRTSSTASPAPPLSSQLLISLSPKYWFSADAGELKLVDDAAQVAQVHHVHCPSLNIRLEAWTALPQLQCRHLPMRNTPPPDPAYILIISFMDGDGANEKAHLTCHVI